MKNPNELLRVDINGITLNTRECFRINFLSQGNRESVLNNSGNMPTRSSHLRKKCGKLANRWERIYRLFLLIPLSEAYSEQKLEQVKSSKNTSSCIFF